MAKKTTIYYILCIGLLIFSIQNVNAQCPTVPMSILNGDNGFVIEGISDNDDLGYSVKDAGDINFDGIADLIIGAPKVDVDGLENVGEAYVIFGGTDVSLGSFDVTTLNGDNGFVIRGIDENDMLGSSVSTAGDFNRDGIDDIMIGSPTQYNSGKVIVIFGSDTSFSPLYTPATINAINGIVIESDTSTGTFGSSVSYAGDVNGDNIADVILGDGTGFVLNKVLRAYVIFGSSSIANMNASAINGSNGFIVEGDEGGIVTVSTAGDINKDGFDDIIFGQPYFQERTGKVSVVFGNDSGASSISVASLTGLNGFNIIGADTNMELGTSVSSAGDFNNDGTDDFIIGAPRKSIESSIAAGEAYVIYGKETSFSSVFSLSSLDTNSGLVIKGGESYDRLGSAVDGLSDINGDGIDDVIMGAISGGIGSQGAAYIIFGGTTHPASINANEIYGSIGYQVFDDTARGFSWQSFGRSVSSLGDFNDDGVSDFIIGATGSNEVYNENGRAYVFFGETFSREDTEQPTFTCPSNQELQINSTLPNYSHYIRNMSDNCTDEWDLTFTQSPEQGTVFTGDTNVTINVYDESGNSSSCTFLVKAITEVVDISCNSEPFLVKNIRETDGVVLYGEKSRGDVGSDVDHVGDVNGDGIDDFIIGASGTFFTWTGPYNLPLKITGAAYVVFGDASGYPPNIDLALLNGENGFVIRNDGAEFTKAKELGVAVSSAGDINGDNIDDIMVSASRRVNGEFEYLGEVFIIFGKASENFPAVFDLSTLNGLNGFKIEGNEGRLIGKSVDNIGDFNKDSYDDIAIMGNNSCYIIYGTNTGFPLVIKVGELDGVNGVIIEGEGNYSLNSVAGLGDVNGDEIDDITLSGSIASGKMFVVYGSESLTTNFNVDDINGINGFNVEHSTESLTQFVSKAGDVNKDGFQDIVFGTNYVLFGGASLSSNIDLADLNGDNGFLIDFEGDLRSVKNINHAGDFNNDGIDDLVFITEINGGGTRLYASILYGKITWEDSVIIESLNSNDALMINLNLYGFFGFGPLGTASYAGDVNNDGIDDVIIGVSEFIVTENSSSNQPGYSYVIYGGDFRDVENPEITDCVEDQNLEIGDLLPNYTIGYDFEATDNCTPIADLVITQSPEEGEVFTGEVEVTLTVTDMSNNESECVFTITVIDEEEPEIVGCPGDQELLCATTKVPDYISVITVTDNSGDLPTVTQSPESGSDFTEGMEITLTATDGSGNSSECIFKLNTAGDIENPEITACVEDQTLEIGALLPNYTIGYDFEATDNCTPITDLVITQTPEPGEPFIDGMTVIITVKDISENTNECEFTVTETVIDTESPEIICLEDQYFVCGATVSDYTAQVAVTDNEDTNPIVIQSALIGTALIDGMEITINAIDESGNESECVFTVYQEIEIALETSTDVTITEGEEVVITAFGNVEGVYEWTPSESLSEANSSVTTATPEETTTYTVLFTTKNDCVATAEVTVTVNALPEDETKYGFSPDNDGINEYWEIDRITEYPNNRVQIYNRWGNLVFEMNNYDNEDRVFNGTANRLQSLGANELPEGTYFFKIYIEGNHHFRKTEGFLLLKR